MAAFPLFRWEEVKSKFLEIIALGLLGMGMPLGVLLILAAFRPQIAQKVDLPPEICILGFAYLIYALFQVWEILKK